MGNWYWGHGIFGLLVCLLLLMLLVSLFVMTIRLLSNKSRTNSDRSDSMTILRTKLEDGEITAEEYQRMRDILNS